MSELVSMIDSKNVDFNDVLNLHLELKDLGVNHYINFHCFNDEYGNGVDLDIGISHYGALDWQ